MNSATASVCLGLVEQIKSQLFSDEFKDRHRRAKKDFTRKRCLPFVIVVSFLLNMVKRSLQDELDEFFKLLNQENVRSRRALWGVASDSRRPLSASQSIADV
jgi:hypothetical protein